MSNIFDSLNDRFNMAFEEHCRAHYHNIDGSLMTERTKDDMLKYIEEIEWLLIGIQEITEVVGGFCSFYPKNCLENLNVMKTILTELDFKNDK